MKTSLEEMVRCLGKGDTIYLPSRYWEMLNRKNLEQLESEGYDNFKQTIALNYFTWLIGPYEKFKRAGALNYLTWLVGPGNNQLRFLLKRTSPAVWSSILKGLRAYDQHSRLTRGRQFVLRAFTIMLWKFAERADSEGLLRSLEEPTEGNPFRISLDGKLISQDLANSVLEYYSIREHFKPSASNRVTICELGAGYGRNAHVFAHALPNSRYIIVDIPPALDVVQRYLSAVLHTKKIFRFRCFESYSEVETELHEADIAFLLPHQARLLPGKSVDLFINISSLHEMKMDQIDAYLRLIDRLTKGIFYSKQFFVSKNPYDNTIIRHSDYLVPSNWQELYLRKAKVQLSFFEAMYATS